MLFLTECLSFDGNIMVSSSNVDLHLRSISLGDGYAGGFGWHSLGGRDSAVKQQIFTSSVAT